MITVFRGHLMKSDGTAVLSTTLLNNKDVGKHGNKTIPKGPYETC